MIKTPFSLRTSIALAILVVWLVIALGYSLLSFSFFFRGMDSIVSANMEKTLYSYTETFTPSERLQARAFNGYFISPSWRSQPKELQQAFQYPPTELGKIQLSKDKPFPFRPSVIHFVIALEADNQQYFVSYKGTAEKASPLIGKNAKESIQILLGVMIITTLLLLLIIWILLRKFSQPIAQLQQWTNNLSPDKLKQTPPHFVYPELNDMAALIRNSLNSVHESLEREHNFLRFTSHELRTPISVIRSNVQLAHKLETADGRMNTNKNKEIINRIDRASLTMQHLSETLLWLSKDHTEALPTTIVRLDKLLTDMIDELQYLLENKQVKITTSLDPYEIELPLAAAQIVISNLIRNAFQHTTSGHVEIRQQTNQIMINNHSEPLSTGHKVQDQGFGLGLRLTEELCSKLAWAYSNIQNDKGHVVNLTIKPIQ